MIEFAWPYALIALPLPFLVALLSPRATPLPKTALRVPFFAAIENASTPQSRHLIRTTLATLVWLSLIAAAVRPQLIGEPLTLPVSGRDLLLAVDISGSMRTEDMVLDDLQSNRLQAVQAVAGEFIERRQGDRIGLILFGGRAYLQAPLTFDRKTVQILLHEAEIGLAGKETAIGDAIGLAVKRLRDQPTEHTRVLVLLTDGANNAGEVEPLRATDLAVQLDLRIYTIGVGADEMIRQGIFGAQRVNPSTDLDENTLQEIANRSGGRYFRARDTEGLEAIYQLLDVLEPVEVDAEIYRPIRELYIWPLTIALALTILLAILVQGGLQRSSTTSS